MIGERLRSVVRGKPGMGEYFQENADMEGANLPLFHWFRSGTIFRNAEGYSWTQLIFAADQGSHNSNSGSLSD
jgi:hypothetical protein